MKCQKIPDVSIKSKFSSVPCLNEIRKRGSKVTWSACLWLCAWLLPPMIEKMSMCPSKPAADSTAGFLGHHWMSKHHWLLVGSSYSTCNVGRVYQDWKIFLSINKAFFTSAVLGFQQRILLSFPQLRSNSGSARLQAMERTPLLINKCYVLKLHTDEGIRMANLQHCWCWSTVCDSLKSWEER